MCYFSSFGRHATRVEQTGLQLSLRSNISKTSASVSSGFKHEKTDESTRPQAKCFYCFRVFETPMKHEARVFLKLLLQQKKISLNYHLNKVSQFNYYI